MAAFTNDNSDLLETGSLERTRTKRLKEIASQQREDDDFMVGYPRTLKTREERLVGSRICKDDFYYRESSDGEETRVDFKNCYLNGLDYLTDERKALQTIKSLNKLDKSGVPKFKSLPIYLVNGHSSIEPRLILEPPEELSAEKVNERRKDTFVNQLENAGFSLHISPSTNNENYLTRDDFYTTHPRSNKFIITTTPMGFDARCGDTSQRDFLQSASRDGFISLRDALLSENFTSFFTRFNRKAAMDDGVSEDNNRFFANNLFIPPGYSVVNKTYQFWDHDPNEKTRDKWGVIRLDTLTEQQISEGALDYFDPPIQSSTPEERLRTMHPLCPPKIKKVIRDAILNQGMYL